MPNCIADTRSMECVSIATFYAGRNIFITGGSGFLGKVLIEKLLRSCPEIGHIFILMRPKKGLSIDERLKKMFELPLFDRLRKENYSSFEKLIPVLGDISLEDLGLSKIERQTIIEQVSIIFHIAANVRFEGNLKKDIFSNVRSTRDVCILAKSMKNLVALVHVSTAYAHVDKPVIDEIVYPSLTDWRNVIKMVESLDEQIIQVFTSKYLGSMPNTYTFSKRIAEQVINDYSKDLPSVIFRPSIVTSTINDPMPGWLDNFNGPVAMMIGGAKGILRIIRLEANACADFLPVDLAIKIMIAAAWKRGLNTITKDPTTYVYNATSYQIHRISNKEMIKMGLKLNEEMPFEGIIWYPQTFITSNRFLYFVLTLLIHVIPALIIDEILKITGRQPMLMKLHKIIYSHVTQLSYFLHNEWIFYNFKMLDILDMQVPLAEREIFSYDYRNFNLNKYFKNCMT
ncbi:putative fatty acyl-CoA reductase CG5065 isoform X1 [Apis dorsata]|uniref:putative fatty acyl-CoA reductase CG5065 isoform X1 n=1 Tax=Apis dorsata TaxID=7462 RepID=UPI0003DF7956|nr:putative fatty acyl-CoA reductase CG5065 isoform X1 [Apis dorsata]